MNYLKLPKGKILGLTGRFCYIQLKLEPPCLFNIHLDLATADGAAARVTVGNVLKDLAAAGRVRGPDARLRGAHYWPCQPRAAQAVACRRARIGATGSAQQAHQAKFPLGSTQHTAFPTTRSPPS